MAFPTTGLLDDCNRANGGLGSNWSSDPRNVLANDANAPQILSNQCHPGALSVTSGAWWNVATFGPDCECYADINFNTTTTFQFLARGQEPSSSLSTFDGYMGSIYRSGTDSVAYINRIDNSSGTQLGVNQNITGLPTKFGIECNGSTIKIWWYVAGAWNSYSQTDSTYSAAGVIGVEFYEANSTATPYLDNFSGGTTITGTISNAVAANANAAATAATDIMAPDVTLTGQIGAPLYLLEVPIAQALAPTPTVDLAWTVPVAEAQAVAPTLPLYLDAPPGTATASAVAADALSGAEAVPGTAQATTIAPTASLAPAAPPGTAQASAAPPYPVSYALPGSATAEAIALPGYAVPAEATAAAIVPAATNGYLNVPAANAQANPTAPVASLRYTVTAPGSATAEALVATSVAPFHWNYSANSNWTYTGSTVTPPPGASTFTYGY